MSKHALRVVSSGLKRNMNDFQQFYLCMLQYTSF
jgi:hypothetical protein